ncbi:fructosamine kinase family protein [Flavitalea sp. BT771]|uniref:fructosamine kinase family protein n=1 Tax=Flavitalea sp. BT771 TaxID=3063329 RepID=UPI0026E168EC|nr:fructosamine kinase family protein [Flavitalea sp. BT771]MDO6432130.1 fructosamine kinase family protein [Flavitalea sp. BT771]MDV6221039.1 fructosamine kinase family protein [Flavitalea sp. BT771]
MSLGISSTLTEVLARSAGVDIASPLQIRAIGGGSINATYHITTSSNRQWFCKINDAGRFPDLFVLERQGLALLEATNAIRVPRVIACENIDQDQVLVLEWIGEGLRTNVFWQRFGEQLAALHRITAPSFGLEHQNYMGALPQSNTRSPDWVDFFIHQRLQPQISLAIGKGLLDHRDLQQFQRLYKALDNIFPKEPPALLHGDLWSGNFLCDEHNHPVLIDPAVYYGHRSVDLAMTTLFGGFERPFYEAYAHHYPFPENHREQWEICNLYPLLIHLNLFGQSYRGNILHTIQRF